MSLLALPSQKPDLEWPTESWPARDLPAEMERTSFDRLVEYGFSDPWPADLGETHALIIVQGGALRYHGC